MQVKADQSVLDQMEGKSSERTIVAVRQPAALGQVTGEVQTQLKLPTLKMAYGVGKLSEKFNQGDLVLDDIYLVAKRGEPVVVTIASVQVYWKQYLDNAARQAGQNPKTYGSKAEAKAAGEIVDWPPRGSDGPKPTVSPAGLYQLLIQRPQGLQCPLFGFECGAHPDGTPIVWAPARWFLDKKAHKVVIEEVEKARIFSLGTRKGGLLAGRFTVTTNTTKRPDGNTETLPQVKFSGANSDAEVEQILKAFTGASSGAADEGEDA